MSRADRLEAELLVLRAEEEFAARKKDGTVTDEDRTVLRQLREDYRLNHRRPVADGASPGSVSTAVFVEGV